MSALCCRKRNPGESLVERMLIHLFFYKKSFFICICRRLIRFYRILRRWDSEFIKGLQDGLPPDSRANTHRRRKPSGESGYEDTGEDYSQARKVWKLLRKCFLASLFFSVYYQMPPAEKRSCTRYLYRSIFSKRFALIVETVPDARATRPE
jgi:hypothetical protein